MQDTLALARMAGLIDWDAIEDRTRDVVNWQTSEDPATRIKEIARNYAVDMWDHQKIWPEVWVEKRALASIIEKPCSELQVPYFVAVGFGSVSELYEAGQRFGEQIWFDQTPVVLYFGDHDPSGLFMVQNIREQLHLFSGHEIEVRPLALTREQAQDLPPNTAKESDPRTAAYVAEHGEDCWELDEPMRDMDQWEKDKEREERDRETLSELSGRWDEVEEFLQ